MQRLNRLERKPIIIGIDPGTTIGYAILDVDGNILEINSGKHLKLSWIISHLTEFGEPIIIACDVSKAPRLIEKIARRFGAKICCPKKDLSWPEKLRITKPYKRFVKNKHERSALSAALHAYESIHRVVEKIKRQYKENLGKLICRVVKKDVAIKKAKIELDQLAL